MDIKKLISEMTLQEKCEMLSGYDFWHTQPLERLGIPSIMVSDGPHGLRKQAEAADHLGLNESVPATCFPSGSALASSWDKELIQEVGAALGEECQAENVSVILGPACNIKRSPLCGRNFEYFSEDPYLATQMAKHHILGVQSQGVGTSIKHFCANNQEAMRMRTDTIVDERTLREIYLAAFETAVKEAKPWTVMCSYNQVNGKFMSCNKELLTDLLKEEWGFEGQVMTDWGAIKNRGDCAAAGLDMEMPGTKTVFNNEAYDAVISGRIKEEDLDKAVERTLRLVEWAVENNRENAEFDKAAHNQLARKAAGECMILLKNDDRMLPVQTGESIAVIGEFAEKPRYQGGGSSHINPIHCATLLDGLKELGADFQYAKGFSIDSDEIETVLFDEAKQLAAGQDKVIIMAGLPDSYESEGYDRTHLNMPPNQIALIKEIAKVNPNVAVVLSNGSAIVMPWLDDVKAVLEAHLGGQNSGGAVADVVTGKVNPSGRLAETFAKRLEDTPAYLNFPCHQYKVEYREGIFVGYRYYDKKKMDILFPFGYGLSYTDFEYSGLKLNKSSMHDSEKLTVKATVKNIGATAGKEVVQLYVGKEQEEVLRAEKELKGFEKIALNPGESKEISFTLDKRSFAYYNVDDKDWFVEEGDYQILIGASSRDIRLEGQVHVIPDTKPSFTADRFSVVKELQDLGRSTETLTKVLNAALDNMNQGDGGALSPQMMQAMVQEMPLASMATIFPDLMSEETIAKIVSEANGRS